MKKRRYAFAEAIKNWPEGDRPREKLIESGPGYLTDSELLAILIGTGSKDKNALDLARALLRQFENIAGIETASVEEIKKIDGIGEAKAVSIKAGVELGRRFVSEQKNIKSASIRTSEDIYTHYLPSMKNLKKEIFKVAMLDSRNRVIKTAIVSEGGLTAAIVQPREVFSHAIKEAAPGVIVMHNHPSGDPEPSADDINLTRLLVEAGEIMNIKVLDHLIIGDGAYFSFADQGLI